jgi:hypothetical protein
MTKNDLLTNYGWCRVLKRGDKYFISYDAGGIAVKMVELEVTKAQANKAQVSQLDAEEVIVKRIKNNG